jgi:hypothetical protein
MKLGSRRRLRCTIGFAIACIASGQTGTEQRPPRAEEVFKNVQVLKGISVDQFMQTMGFFSAALGVSCSYCHVADSGGDWAKYADDNAHKRTARRMVTMISAINQTYFGRVRMVTCYSCHRTDERPRLTPNLADLYGAPLAPDPNEMLSQAPGGRTADQILDKYIEALGGAARLANLTGIVAKGTYQGYAESEKRPVEVFSKAPGQRTVIVHLADGDSTSVWDGKAGWTARPATDVPVPLLALSGGDLDAARLEAELSFPARIKQTLTDWRVGFPATIDDRDVQVVQGNSAGRSPVKFYFDNQSGLLVRMVHYAELPIGLSPTQIDFADYREAGGVKIPFRWTITWLDGRSTIEFSEVQANVPIDAARFARPPAPGSAKQ